MTENKKKLLLGIVLGAPVFLLGCTSCSFLNDAVEEGVEEAIEESSGVDDFDVDEDGWTVTGDDGESTYSYGDSAEWPSDAPSDLPEFTYGTITSSAKTTTEGSGISWTVLMEDCSSDAADKYQADLEASGWTVDVSVDSADAVSFNATKGAYMATVYVDKSDNSATLYVSDVS